MDRQDAMGKLNSGSDRPHVMLLSLLAGGVGLNLIGANHMILLEPHWNPQLELQAMDRIHRFGQTKECRILRYLFFTRLDCPKFLLFMIDFCCYHVK